MDLSHRVPLIAGIIGFIADIIGIGTFVFSPHQSEASSTLVPIMIFVIIGYSWFILAWMVARVAIIREVKECKTLLVPFKRSRYRFISAAFIGVLAAPIVVLTAARLDPEKGPVWAIVLLACTVLIIFAVLTALMPLIHDESAYK